MKRTCVLILLMLLTFTIFTGCSNASLEKISDSFTIVSDVEMVAKVEESNSDDDIIASLTIKNLSIFEIFYSEEIELHILDDGEWYFIPHLVTDISEVAYGISVNNESNITINLSGNFGILENGTYRIMKPIYGLDVVDGVVCAEIVIE